MLYTFIKVSPDENWHILLGLQNFEAGLFVEDAEGLIFHPAQMAFDEDEGISN